MQKQYLEQYKRTKTTSSFIKLQAAALRKNSYKDIGGNGLRGHQKLELSNHFSKLKDKSCEEKGTQQKSFFNLSKGTSLHHSKHPSLILNQEVEPLKESNTEKMLPTNQRASSIKCDELINVTYLSNLLSRKPTYLEIRNRKIIKTENNSTSASKLPSKYSTIAMKQKKQCEQSKRGASQLSCSKTKNVSVNHFDSQTSKSTIKIEGEHSKQHDLTQIYQRTKQLLQARKIQEREWKKQQAHYQQQIHHLQQQLNFYRNSTENVPIVK